MFKNLNKYPGKTGLKALGRVTDNATHNQTTGFKNLLEIEKSKGQQHLNSNPMIMCGNPIH